MPIMSHFAVLFEKLECNSMAMGNFSCSHGKSNKIRSGYFATRHQEVAVNRMRITSTNSALVKVVQLVLHSGQNS